MPTTTDPVGSGCPSGYELDRAAGTCRLIPCPPGYHAGGWGGRFGASCEKNAGPGTYVFGAAVAGLAGWLIYRRLR